MPSVQFFVKYRTIVTFNTRELPDNADFKYISLLFFKRTRDPVGLCKFKHGIQYIDPETRVSDYPDLEHSTFIAVLPFRQPDWLSTAALDRDHMSNHDFMSKWFVPPSQIPFYSAESIPSPSLSTETVVRRLMTGHAAQILLDLSQKANELLSCPICLKQITSDICMTVCGHIYHKECLDCWLPDSCPTCRKSLQ